MLLGVLLLSLVVMSESTRGPPPSDQPIVVVGAGLAGLSATIELLEQGAKVILIDGEKNFGGNSAKASSGMSACETSTQEKLGIKDSKDLFVTDTLSAGDRENDVALVQTLVAHSADAVDFLIEHGVDLTDINLCGGHSVPRTHWIPSPKEGKPIPVGFEIIRNLKAKVLELEKSHPDQITIMLNTRVVGLVSWNDYIVGVRVKGEDSKIKEVHGKGVIMATGGFTADRNEEASLLLEFAGDKAALPTTNGAFARGDGVKMARAMGAAVVGMERVQVHPTAFIDPAKPSDHTKFLAAEALRGKGAILINGKGQRFGNELGRRDYLTARIQKECSPMETFQGGSGTHPVAVMLMNDATADSFGRPAFNFYANIKKFFVKYDNAAALAQAMGVDSKVIEKTLEEYNQMVAKEGKKKDSFGKTVFPAAFPVDQPLYAALITPALHYSMGGLKIDTQAQTWNEYTNKSFKGLLAAGEVAGGVHGSNRLAGNSLLECVVFGRIAARTAAKIDYSNDQPIYRADHTDL